MKAIVVLSIALTWYQIGAGKSRKLSKIEIDILTKVSTEHVTITPVEDGDITTYQFVPNVDYKEITLKYEKNIIITLKKDRFRNFEVIWYNKYKNGDEPLILRLKSLEKEGEKWFNYYKFSNGWGVMIVALYDYLCTVMKEGKELSDNPVEEYREWKKKQEQSTDDKKDDNTSSAENQTQNTDNTKQSTEDDKKDDNTSSAENQTQNTDNTTQSTEDNTTTEDNQTQSTEDNTTQNTDNTTPQDESKVETVVSKVTPVDLDIHTREDTNQVKVTKIENKSMVTYKIEPQSGYKVGRFTDGDKIILDPKQDEGFIYLEVKCVNTDVNYVILTSLIRSHEGSDTVTLNYYCLEDNWVEVTDQFCSFLIDTMKSGIVYSSKNVVNAYENHVKESNKNKVEIDVLKKDNIPAGVTMKDAKEFGVDVSVYGVDENIAISKIMYGPSTIWRKKDDVYGCYEVRVYYSERTPAFFKLLIKNVRDTELLYIKNIQHGLYSLISKEDFDKGMERLKSNKNVELSLTNENNTANNQRSSNINQSGRCDAIMRFFGRETPLVIDISTNQIAGIKFSQYDKGNIITYKFTCMPKFGITKILSRGVFVWKSKDGKYKCYDINIDKIGENIVVLRLFLKHKSDSKELYFEKVDDKFVSIDRITYYVKFVNTNNV